MMGEDHEIYWCSFDYNMYEALCSLVCHFFFSISELVEDGINGLIFQDAKELLQQLKVHVIEILNKIK